MVTIELTDTKSTREHLELLLQVSNEQIDKVAKHGIITLTFEASNEVFLLTSAISYHGARVVWPKDKAEEPSPKKSPAAKETK